jgi:hypothetical protein
MDNYRDQASHEPDFNYNPQLLPRLNRDMRFVGICYIIYGAFICLSIIGALVGVPMIISGLRLRDAAKGLESWQQGQSPQALFYAFEKQRSFFFIQKVFIIIGLVIFLLYILFFMIYGVAMFNQWGSGYEYETGLHAGQLSS